MIRLQNKPRQTTWVDRQTNRRIDKGTDGWAHTQRDQWMNGVTERQTDKQTEKQTDGQTDKWNNKQKSLRIDVPLKGGIQRRLTIHKCFFDGAL